MNPLFFVAMAVAVGKGGLVGMQEQFSPVLVGVVSLVVVQVVDLIKQFKVMPLLEKIVSEPARVVALLVSIGFCVGIPALVPEALRVTGVSWLDGVIGGMALQVPADVLHNLMKGMRVLGDGKNGAPKPQ